MTTKRAKKTTVETRARASRKGGRKIPVLPVVFVTIASLLVAAILLSGGDSLSDEERITAVAGSPTITGSAIALHQNGAPDLAVGQVAPSVTGVDFEDDSYGEQGPDPGQLNLPLDMLIDSAGRVIVANYQNKRVEIIHTLP